MSEANGHHEHLEARAAEVRARLARRLDLIDERRHRVADLARAVTRPPVSIVLLAAAGIAATLFVVQRVRARRRREHAISRWLVPALPPVPRERSLMLQGLEKAAASLVAVAVKRLGERGLEQLLREAPPGPRAV